MYMSTYGIIVNVQKIIDTLYICLKFAIFMAGGKFSMLGDSAFIDINSVDLVVSCLNQTSNYGYLIL